MKLIQTVPNICRIDTRGNTLPGLDEGRQHVLLQYASADTDGAVAALHEWSDVTGLGRSLWRASMLQSIWASSFHVAPRNRRLVISATVQGGSNNMAVSTLDTFKSVRLASSPTAPNTGNARPQISRTGRSVIYFASATPNNWQAFSLNPRTGLAGGLMSEQTVTPIVAYSSLIDDGKRVLAVGTAKGATTIFDLDENTGVATERSNNSALARVGVSYSYAAAGKELIALTSPAGGSPDIYRYADGQFQSIYTGIPYPDWPGTAGAISIAADDSAIAYGDTSTPFLKVYKVDKAGTYGVVRPPIVAADLPGGGPFMRFSRTGRSIIIGTRSATPPHIWAYRWDGNTLTKINTAASPKPIQYIEFI